MSELVVDVRHAGVGRMQGFHDVRVSQEVVALPESKPLL